MARAVARFASVPIGPGLSASDGGVTLTTDTDALDLQRMAISTVGHVEGVHGAEFTFWGDADLHALVGLAPSDASLNVHVGAAAAGVGWDLETGIVYSGGTPVASGLPSVAKGDTVGVLLRAVDGSRHVEFYLGNMLVLSHPIVSATWHFAASLAAVEAATLWAAVNAGQWQAAGPAAAAGWRTAAPVVPTVRLSDIDYLDGEHQRWEGLIDASGLATVAALGFWPWGGADPVQGAAAQLTLQDAGVLDDLAAADIAGAPVAVRTVTESGESAIARLAVDRVETLDDGRKQLHLRDAHDDLDESANPGQFLPSIPALAWRTQPMVIGAVASVPYLGANSDGSVGWLADAPLAHVDAVLDRGDPMEPGTWGLADDGQQILLEQPPVGPVVADVSSIGPGMQPASLEEALYELFGRIGKSAWSSADAAAIDAATGYAGIGYYAGDAVTVREALAAILPSYGAWLWQDGDGVLRFTRVVDPETLAPAFDLDGADLAEDLVLVPDAAPNLSRRMAYQPNARILSAGELVTDLVDVPVWRRNELSSAWRGQVYSAQPLAARYAHADTNPPLVSVFWRPQDAQTEIDRVCAMYARPRAFYQATLAGELDLAPRPGQACRLTYDRYGLESGRLVLVRAVERNPATGSVVLTLWG